MPLLNTFLADDTACRSAGIRLLLPAPEEPGLRLAGGAASKSNRAIGKAIYHARKL